MKDLLILEYHSISFVVKRPLAVKVDNFEKQVRYLSDKCYTPISFDDLYKSMRGNVTLPKKPLIITFDDGYLDNYTYAFPILKKYGFTATIFLATDYIDNTVNFDLVPASQGGRNILSWKEVNELSEAGWSFGSHTCSHSILTEISIELAKDEIASSKSRIEMQTGKAVTSFCYPAGKFNDRIKGLVKQSGYRTACTEIMPNEKKEDLFSLERIGIYRGDSLSIFRMKIAKWFRYIQKHDNLYNLFHFARRLCQIVGAGR